MVQTPQPTMLLVDILLTPARWLLLVGASESCGGSPTIPNRQPKSLVTTQQCVNPNHKIGYISYAPSTSTSYPLKTLHFIVFTVSFICVFFITLLIKKTKKNRHMLKGGTPIFRWLNHQLCLYIFHLNCLFIHIPSLHFTHIDVYLCTLSFFKFNHHQTYSIITLWTSHFCWWGLHENPSATVKKKPPSPARTKESEQLPGLWGYFKGAPDVLRRKSKGFLGIHQDFMRFYGILWGFMGFH